MVSKSQDMLKAIDLSELQQSFHTCMFANITAFSSTCYPSQHPCETVGTIVASNIDKNGSRWYHPGLKAWAWFQRATILRLECYALSPLRRYGCTEVGCLKM